MKHLLLLSAVLLGKGLAARQPLPVMIPYALRQNLAPGTLLVNCR